MFQRNEGSLDRDIRLALGLFFAFLTIFYAHGVFVIVGAVLAVVMFVTAASGFCPVYAALHIQTEKN